MDGRVVDGPVGKWYNLGMFTLLNHPLVNHRVTLMRDLTTRPKLFRELVGELTTFLAYEALRDIRTEKIPVSTPVAEAEGDHIVDRVVIVPILRAGMGMLDAALDVLPFATVGVLGMQRSEQTAEPVPYYAKVPPMRGEALALVVDPMLATGGSACDAVTQLKRLGYSRIKFLSLIASRQGLTRFEQMHPDVPLYSAALDEELNEQFYIVPGLGDAGDRIFGTEENSTLSKIMKAMERKVLADGVIDLAETDEMLRQARDFVGMGDDFAQFREIIKDVRADGVVTPAESRRLAGILAALADKADAYAIRICPKCGRPVSVRSAADGRTTCPWCGADVAV